MFLIKKKKKQENRGFVLSLKKMQKRSQYFFLKKNVFKWKFPEISRFFSRVIPFPG